jgi:ADP-ribose pyrophosphatase
MTFTPPGRLDIRRAYTGRFLNLDEERVKAPDGSIIQLEIIRHPGAAAIVPILSNASDPDPQVLMLKQYRYATGGTIWEIPAGVLQPGEAPRDCAHRELLEETGAQAERIEHLTTIYTTPGFTDERIHLFCATGLTLGESHHEKDEFIEVRAQPLSRVLEMIGDGEITDAKSIVALLFLAGFRLGR